MGSGRAWNSETSRASFSKVERLQGAVELCRVLLRHAKGLRFILDGSSPPNFGSSFRDGLKGSRLGGEDTVEPDGAQS